MVIKKFFMVSILLSLAGCNTAMYNQPGRSATVYKPPSAPESASASSSAPTSSSVPVRQPVIKAPQSSSSVILPSESVLNRSSNAMAGLLDQGWGYYNDENYESSISVAERAMRINRQDPEVYLLLSRSYLGLWQLTQAEQMARQGLALATRGSGIYEQLEDTMSEIQRAQ